MRRIIRLVAVGVCAVALAACDAENDGNAGTTLDTVGSKIEQGAETIGEKLDTAVSGIRAELDEGKIERMLHNIQGLENVEVDLSTGGDVTLIGSAPSDERRMEAERIVRQMEGVSSVVNAIKVGGVVPDSRDTMVLEDSVRTL